MEHRGPDAVGADARDVHVLDLRRAQVGHGAQAEPHDRVLRGGVDPLAGHRGQAGERGDVDDLSATAGPHRLDGGQGAVHRPDRVDLEHQPALLRVVLPRGPGEEHAGIVDPDVQTTGDGDDLVARGPHGRVVTHVEGEGRGPLAELARCLLRCSVVDVGDEHVVAALDEHGGDLAAETAPGPGDHRPGRPAVARGGGGVDGLGVARAGALAVVGRGHSGSLPHRGHRCGRSAATLRRRPSRGRRRGGPPAWRPSGRASASATATRPRPRPSTRG